jgi:hypothetical protein
VTALLFAFLFSVLAVAQYLFVRYQLFSAARSEAAESAQRIAAEIVGTNGIDLAAVRNAFFPVGEWYIVGNSGSVIDLEGRNPEIVGRVTLPDKLAFGAPQTLVSEFEEEWRLLARALKGGTLVVGLRGASDLANPDAMLFTNAVRFGTTLEEAVRVNPKQIDDSVDYVVLTQDGGVRKAIGGLPLKIDPGFLGALLSKPEVDLSGRRYILTSFTATDLAHKPLATVVVPKDVTIEHKALRDQARFNILVSTMAWFVVVSILVAYFVREEIHRQRIHPTLAEARKRGEGQYIEFKRSLLWDRERGYEDENLKTKILRAIVSFLNSGGGALFIGIDDDGKPWGLADDLKRCDGSEDKFHQRLRNMIINSIGAEFSQHIMTDIWDDPDFSGYRVCFVGVEAARQAAFLKSGSHSYFYIRSGPETLELDMQRAYRHIRKAGLEI